MDGMTDAQYKGMLLNQRENWRRVLIQAKAEGAEKTAVMVREQIELIGRKLEF